MDVRETDGENSTDRYLESSFQHIPRDDFGALRITIKLTKPSSKFTFNGDEVHEGYFSFSPSVKVKAYWVDDQTLEYRPTEVMRSGKVYSSSLALSKLFKGVEPKLKTLRFSFRVIPQSVSIELNGLIVRDAENPNSYELDGTVQQLMLQSPRN